MKTIQFQLTFQLIFGLVNGFGMQTTVVIRKVENVFYVNHKQVFDFFFLYFFRFINCR